jgi:ribosome-associated protein
VRHPVEPVGAIDDLIAATLRRVGKGHGSPVEEAVERVRQRESLNAAADERLRTQLKRAVSALLDKKAEKLVVLNLEGLTTMSDYFVLATAMSDRQAQALADAVETAMKAEGRRPMSVEGYNSAAWILLDYGDVVFHLFHDEARRFYGLERLWGDAPDATSHFS